MRAVIIDDEYPALDELTYLLRQRGAEVAGAFADPSEGFAFVTKQKPEVVFLDIDMPGISGIELGIKIQNLLPQIILVFVTAYSQYALQAFQAYPLDYILKPIDEERFDKTIEHIAAILNEKGGSHSSLRIRCFGTLEVIAGNNAVRFPTRKTRELLAYLLCGADSPVYRDEILRYLFENEDERKGANNLRVTLYRLRNALAAAGIEKDKLLIRDDYSLVIPDGVCDFVDFRRFVSKNAAIDRDNLPEAEKICDSYSSGLLNDIDDVWVSEKREWAEIQAEKLLMKLSLHFISQRETNQAEKYLLRLLQLNPLAEQGYSVLLNLFSETGEQNKYRYYSNRYKKLLKDEILSPSDL
jgi:two-component system LytT family response regulator